MPEAHPQRIGRYEIRRELGRGMMGVVYEAADAGLGRTVALKTIQLAFPLSPGEREVFEQRFLAEARIAARLSHPGIVAVHDVGRDPETGTLYIALEYLEGRTLAAIIEAGDPTSWREALRIAARIAEALHHAHAQGVIHRDVKPANIMILPSGEAKLMDFGIAKTETARIKLTAAGQFFGTPLYMAPEQALGRAVDARADLFSLGSIAYVLLTGRNAFAAENITKIIGKVVHLDPPPPSRLVPGLPPDVDYVLARALAKDPNRRYPEGRALAEDIEDVLAGAPPRHRGGSTPARAEATLVDPAEAELDVDELLRDQLAPGADPGPPPLDLEAQLATLLPSTPSEPSPAPAQPPPSAPARPSRPPLRPALPGRRPASRFGRLLAVGLLAGALLAVALRLAPTRDVPSAPATGRSGAGLSPPAEPIAPARLVLELEHSLKSGTLRIWVDRELVAEQPLDSRARKTLAGFRSSSDEPQEYLELTPGGHDVEVQVAWDDSQKTERLRGEFRARTTRRLRARLGGLLKRNLSLRWE